MPVIVVTAAVVERDGLILITRRLHGTHLAGMWEFPGGKCEAGETHEECLVREIQEELGVEVVVGPEMLSVQHVYPERAVELHFRRCEIRGEPRPMIGQEIRWVLPSGLAELEFPEADRELIRLLSEPSF